MVEFDDIISANDLLVKFGGEDQMSKLIATAIERSLDLQNRVDKALEYAKTSPSKNSTSMQKIASILDGVAAPVEVEVVKPKPKPTPKKPAPKKSGSGLASRPRSERLAFRNWAREQGFTVPTAGPVPQSLVNAYDMAQVEMKRMREEASRTQTEPSETPPDTV